MEPIDLAIRYLYPYTQKGVEIIPVYCPFCQGGQSRDKHTFALNTEKQTYNCKRGSCGVAGNYKQLITHFEGNTTSMLKSNLEFKKPKQKEYTKPAEDEMLPLTETVINYLRLRKISPETCALHKLSQDGKSNILFPYYENGNLVMIKYRPARKLEKGEKKGWRSTGGKPVLWGMELCTTDKPLVITEGEMDTLSLNECGIDNVVSVPSGCEDTIWIDLCWDWLNQFKKIILFGDKDEAGERMIKNISSRLGTWRCAIVQNDTDYKDANEILYKYGPDKIIELVSNALEIPFEGLVQMSEVEPFDYSKTERISSGITGFDKIIGGHMMGELSVWSGINASGKSTFVNQQLIEAINQNYSVCIYSGELKLDILKYWMSLQSAGAQHIEMRYDKIKQDEVPYVPKHIQQQINSWFHNKFLAYNSFLVAEMDSILKVFEYAVKRYNSKMFILDNLMTVKLSVDKDLNMAQSNFILQLKTFAHNYDVSVHLIAHPKKTNGERMTKDDVKGTGDISNLADNVYCIHKLKREEKVDENENVDSIVEVLKNRFAGNERVEVPLKFDRISKRFYALNDKYQGQKNYSWCKTETKPISTAFQNF